MAFFLLIGSVFQQGRTNHGDSHTRHMRNRVIGSRLENLLANDLSLRIAEPATAEFHRPGRGTPTFFRQSLTPGLHTSLHVVTGFRAAFATGYAGHIYPGQAGWKIILYPAPDIVAESVQIVRVFHDFLPFSIKISFADSNTLNNHGRRHTAGGTHGH